LILDPLADEISRTYPIIVKIIEVRGHGESSGKRGYSIRKSCIWRDIKTFMAHFRFNHPECPIFLGGHRTDGGMVLNYSTWSQREDAEGYVYFAPDFGPEFNRVERTNKFYSDLKAKVFFIYFFFFNSLSSKNLFLLLFCFSFFFSFLVSLGKYFNWNFNKRIFFRRTPSI